MLKTTHVIAALIFCAFATLANAETYTGITWGLDRTSTPYKIGINLSGVWYEFATFTSLGVSNLPHLDTANTWAMQQTFSVVPRLPFTGYAKWNGLGADPTVSVTVPSEDIAGLTGAIDSEISAFAPCVNILAHGGDAGGTAPNDAAFASALAANAPDKICVYFPAGTYAFTASAAVTLSATYPSAGITIAGAGAEVTRLFFQNATNGVEINLNNKFQSTHLQNLSILSNVKSNSTIGYHLSMLLPVTAPGNAGVNDISGVAIHGADGLAQTDRFGTNIDLDGVSNVNITNSNIVGSPESAAPYATEGTCINYHTTQDSSAIPVVLNLIGTVVNYCGTGLQLNQRVQGVSISSSNFTGNSIGIWTPPLQLGMVQLAITASQFNSSLYSIKIESSFQQLMISSNLFYVSADGTNIYIDNTNSYSIVGNNFTSLQLGHGYGIHLNNWFAQTGTIVANMFQRSLTAIELAAGSKNVSISPSNVFDSVTNTITDAGTNNNYSLSGTVASIDLYGSHTYGLDTSNGSYATGAIRLGNNQRILSKDNLGATQTIMRMDTGNNLDIGEGAGVILFGGTSVSPLVNASKNLGTSVLNWNSIYGTNFFAGGLQGLSVTKTVRASGGVADCTLIFTGGLLTGGTC